MTLFKEKLKVFKLRSLAKLPVRAHSSDAGMDLFYCPEDNMSVAIEPSMTCLLQTGLKIQVPSGHMLEIKNKSGIAFKRQLIVGACVVDSGYDGEVFVNLHNIGFQIQILEPGQKIAQAILVPIAMPGIEEISEDRVYESPTSRGAGGFGSTGEK